MKIILYTQYWAVSARIKNRDVVAGFDFGQLLSILEFILSNGVPEEFRAFFVAAEILRKIDIRYASGWTVMLYLHRVLIYGWVGTCGSREVNLELGRKHIIRMRRFRKIPSLCSNS